MTWTTEKPSQPGWYWWREDETFKPVMCELVPIPWNTFWVHWIFGMEGGYLLDIDGQWAGPLVPPKETP